MLKFCIVSIIIFTVILFVLGVYTLLMGLSGAMSSSSAFGLKLDKGETNGDWSLTFDGAPRNNGILSETLSIQLGILDSNKEYIAFNSTSVQISPGEQKPLTLTLIIPHEYVQKYNLNSTQGVDVVFELKFSIRTLGDLVGFSQLLRIAGDAQL